MSSAVILSEKPPPLPDKLHKRARLAISALLKRNSAVILSEKPPPLPEKLYKRACLAPSDTTSIKGQEQVNKIDDDDDDFYFDDEEEEEAQWSLEQRMATLQDTKMATEAFLMACTDLKKNVSTKVDDLLKDLPDANDPQFEKKYKMVRRKLKPFLPKKSYKSEQSTEKKR